MHSSMKTGIKNCIRCHQWLCLVVLLSSGIRIQATDTSCSTLVQTTLGTIEGYVNTTYSVCSFLGIPYAQPPINELRWKAPQPHAHFVNTWNASSFGSQCIQSGAFAAYSQNLTQSENCLFLNVWVPSVSSPRSPSSSSTSLLPVKVWIHGGGYSSGSGADYDGTVLASLTRTIVVTLNYRLGIFGFWSSSGLLAENRAMNFGLQDQNFALQWIARSISAFGGDPKNILLFGESAGGGSVFAHLFLSAEYFSKAIMQSPGPWKLLSLQDALQTNDRAILPPCNSVGNASAILSCLRLLNTSMISRTVVGYPIPVIDGETIFDQPAVMLEKYQQRMSNIPILIGNNLNEGNIFTYDEFHSTNISLSMIESALNTWVLPPYVTHNRTQVREVFSSYETIGNQTGNWFEALSDLYADQYIDCGVALFSDLASNSSTNPQTVFRYRFDHSTVDWELSFLNATHAEELAYIWRNGYLNTHLDADENTLSLDLISYWNNFHLTGDPSSPSLPEWPKYNSSIDSSVISFEIQRNYTLVSHPESIRCEKIWYALLAEP